MRSLDATIIIPTFNREDALIKTLSALANMNCADDCWEAIVVDDGSTSDTQLAVQQWIKHSGAPVRYLRQCNAGPAVARNRGAAEARGRNLIFIDNDIIVPRDFVRLHLDALKANPGSWVMGRIIHPAEMRATPFGRYRDDVWDSFYSSYPADRISCTTGMSAANVSMPAEDFHRLGGFDESFTIASSEDWDLGLRARQNGIRILYHPGIVVLHNDWAVSLAQFCKRQMMYSISDVLLWRKYGETSLRAQLVRQNAPLDWISDGPKLIIKKMLKRLMATKAGERIAHYACSLVERCVPDGYWTRRMYELAVAIAIFRGVREGWRRYVTSSSAAHNVVQFEKAR